ncbi:MAG: hypothetical protein Ct9H90mP16_06120 [Candidatus Poseidoniales archaeon]|nr:MAG: hypothetical protein Ct9H90mP16_06120 [Candidatus Poseidoniales archaeon]
MAVATPKTSMHGSKRLKIWGFGTKAQDAQQNGTETSTSIQYRTWPESLKNAWNQLKNYTATLNNCLKPNRTSLGNMLRVNDLTKGFLV